MNTKQLKSAAEELIEVLGLVDDETKETIVITKDTSVEDVTALIIEAAGELTPDDEISDATRDIIDTLVNGQKKAKGKKPVAVEIEEEEEEEEEIEEDEEVEEEENIDALIEEIESAEKVKDLKAIVSNFDVFKEHSKALNAIKNIDDLREAMLNIVNPDEDVQEPATEPEPKKSKKQADVVPEEPVVPKKAPKEKKEKPAKKEKAPKAPKVKKERVPSRQDFVITAIKTLCKKGATLKQIMDHSDELYVQAGGETNPTATNVNTYTLSALIAFNVLSKTDGIYKLNK